MTRLRFWQKPPVWMGVLVCASYATAATLVVIDVLDRPYRNLRLSTATSPAQAQPVLGATRWVALSRARSGGPLSALPSGTTLQITWPDGSREFLRVVDPRSPTGVVPVKEVHVRPDMPPPVR